MSNTNIGESLGLLAYYESLDKIPRDKMLKDFAKQDNLEIFFTAWILKDYPRFLSRVYLNKKIGKLPDLLKKHLDKIIDLRASSDKSKLNKKLDSLMIKTTKSIKSESGKIIAKYLIARKLRKKQNPFEAVDDVSSVVAFIINSEIDFQNKLVKKYE